MDLSKLKDLFLSEAEDNLQKISDGLLFLEKKPDDRETLEETMRAAHTLKSSSAAMGYTGMASAMHAMENILDSARRGASLITAGTSDALFAATDKLKESLQMIRESGKEADLEPLTSDLQKASEDPSGFLSSPENPNKKLIVPETDKISHIKVPVSRLDALMNLTEELLVGKMNLQQIASDVESEELQKALDRIGRLLSDMQYQVTQSRLVPLDQIFSRFPRMVRDLSKSQSKNIEFNVTGEDVELDRSVVDKLAEPVTHLIRNAVDHGIERNGTITLSAGRERDFVIISVQDSGRGIDWEKIITAAENKALIGAAEGEQLRKETSGGVFSGVKKLLFSKGVSTKEGVTETSGRGIGLSAVKAFADEAGGRVSVETVPGGGSRFTLELPVMIAVLNSLIVSSGEETFAVPFADIERSAIVPEEDIKIAADRDVAIIGGEDVPLISLEELFNPSFSSAKESAKNRLVIVVKRGEEKIGITVNRIIGKKEIAAKPLPAILRGSRGCSGLSVLGDGRPVLIIDAAVVFKDKGDINF